VIVWVAPPYESPGYPIPLFRATPTCERLQVKGIYEIKKDTLRICAAEEGDARPAEFKVAEDSRAIILTLRREKKKEDK